MSKKDTHTKEESSSATRLLTTTFNRLVPVEPSLSDVVFYYSSCSSPPTRGLIP
ncbi:hypothetical protein V3C99_000887 [Haemonchus contortus]